MANIDDFSRIGFVLDNFTNAELVSPESVDRETAKLSREWRNSDGSNAPLVRFSMPVNGVFYVVEAVPSSKAKSLAVVSAYIRGKNNESTLKQVLDLSSKTGSGTSETPLAILDASRDSVAQNPETVKRDEWLPSNMDVEDDIPSNMDVIAEDGDGLPDNMELEADVATGQNEGGSDPFRRSAPPPLGHQGEAKSATEARVRELREQIAQDEAYLTAKERDMQSVADVARARLENERQMKELEMPVVTDQQMQALEQNAQAQKILTDAGADDVRFVSGTLEIKTESGKPLRVQGVTQDGTVWLNIGAKDGILKTAEHEAMHLRMENEPGLRDRLIDADKAKFSPAASPKENDKTALAYFGKTYKWSETGYVLLDGSKLDFSGRHEGGSGGYRSVDHRDISDAFDGDFGDGSYTGGMVQFMQEGNIRISPESGGINLAVMPTKAQMDSLSDFISRERGEVILDIDDENGNTLSSTEYPKGTHANKVLQDIRNYFQSGQTPQAGSEPTVQQFRLSPETQGANARQLGNNEPSPHQSPTATASPQGEAMGAAEAFKPYDYDKLPGKARRWIRQRGERDRQ